MEGFGGRGGAKLPRKFCSTFVGIFSSEICRDICWDFAGTEGWTTFDRALHRQEEEELALAGAYALKDT